MIKYYEEVVATLGLGKSTPVRVEEDHRPRVVIALDEAHVLHDNPEPFRRATVLLRTVKEYSTKGTRAPIWVVFASTTSKVTHFADPQPLCT